MLINTTGSGVAYSKSRSAHPDRQDKSKPNPRSIAMRYNLLALFGGALMMAALPVFAATNNNAAEPGVAALLNQATQINKSEQDMADMLSNKRGTTWRYRRWLPR